MRDPLNIVVLDACRTNHHFRSPGGSRGLAAPLKQYKGSILVYATSAGGDPPRTTRGGGTAFLRSTCSST